MVLACGLISGILLARMLGAEDRGLLAAITYWPGFIIGIGALGINEGIVLQIASGDRAKAIVATALALALGLTLLVSAVAWVVLMLLVKNEEYLGSVQLYACLFALISYVSLFLIAVEHGRMRFMELGVLRALQAVVYPLALFCVWGLGGLDVTTAMGAALLGGVVVSLLLICRLMPELSIRPSLTEMVAILKKSVRLHAVNVLMSLSEQLDKMILVSLASNDRIGHYVVAYTVAAAAPAVLVQTYANVMLPMAARNGGSGYTNAALVKSLRMAFMLMVFAAIAVMSVIPWALPFVFGLEYQESVAYAQVLVFALAIGGMRKCVLYLLRARQVTVPSLWAEGATAMCLAITGYLAYRQAGVVGLCWAVVIAQGLGLWVAWRGFQRHIGYAKPDSSVIPPSNGTVS